MKSEIMAEPVKHAGKYKETDLGIIPEDWNVVRVRDIAEVKRGAGSQYLKYSNESNGIRFIRINDFFDNNPVYIQPTKDVYRFAINDRDILFAGTGNTAGESFTPPMFWYGLPHSYNAPRIRVFKQFDKVFIAHTLKSYYVARQQRSLFVGAAQPFLDITAISGFYIALPYNTTEQNAIATALSDADALIAGLEKLIEKKKKIKQGAMQELLSPLDSQGKLKEGWVKRKLGEIGYTYGGLSGKSKEDFSIGNSSYIQFMNIMSNTVIELSELPRVYIRNGEKQNTAKKGDMFFNGSSETPEEVGMCSVLLHDVTNLYLNSFCFGFRPFEVNTFDGLFLANYFRSPFGRKLFFSSAQGATRYNLSKSNFLKLEIFLPDYNTQCGTASIIQDLDSEILNISRKLRKTQLLKQGMMQNLLTGKIRLIQNK